MELTVRYSNHAIELNMLQTALDDTAKKGQRWPTDKPPKRHKIYERLKPATISELVAAYEAGTPTTALTKHYRLGKGTVLKILKDHQVAMRRQGLPADRLPEAIQLYEQGWSTKRIGDLIGCNAETVRYTLKRAGVNIRRSR